MSGQRKSIGVKFTEQQNLAIEKWMTETSCSRQVAIIGLLVKGAKEMGVWDDAPRAGASRFARNHNHNGICTTYGEGTSSTRSGSSTSPEILKSDKDTSENTSSEDDLRERLVLSLDAKAKHDEAKEEEKPVNDKLDELNTNISNLVASFQALLKGKE